MFRAILLAFLFLSPVTSFAGEEEAVCKDAPSCYELGDHSFSVGEVADAQKFFEKAVQLGDTKRAGFALGATYAEEGEFEKALGALQKSCSAGYESACKNITGTKEIIAKLKKVPQGVAKHWVAMGTKRMESNHVNLALSLFTKACDRNYPVACTKKGEALDVKGEKESAKAFLKKGCDGKDYEGCRLLGVFEYRAGRPEEARKIFSDACKKKHYPSCGFFAGMELKAGKQEEGLSLLDDACKHNVLDACESLAFHYGKLKNDSKAQAAVAQVKKILKPQCDSGKQPEACRRIASLK